MMPIKIHCPPSLEGRPFELTVERVVSLSGKTIFHAWTKGWGEWFADPETVISTGGPNSLFFFEVRPPGMRHPHYGRYLGFELYKSLQLTWVTGPNGTKGAETVVTLELEPVEGGTKIKLTHAGFPDEESRDKHKGAWPMVLEQLELKMKPKETIEKKN